MDTEVKLTIRKIFQALRKQQPKMRPRESDRVNIDQMLKEHREHEARNK